MHTHKIEGDRVPDIIFKTRVRDDSIEGPNPYRWQDLTTDEIFANKKIVLFALPGAFTPTCSSFQLPGYERSYEEFQKLGIDQVICLSVNDAFVMFQWAKAQEVKNVFMLPDGNADFTREMGMLVQKHNLGFGDRSWRYSMYVDNGVIGKIFSEAGKADNIANDPYEVSDEATMLNYLRSIA